MAQGKGPFKRINHIHRLGTRCSCFRNSSHELDSLYHKAGTEGCATLYFSVCRVSESVTTAVFNNAETLFFLFPDFRLPPPRHCFLTLFKTTLHVLQRILKALAWLRVVKPSPLPWLNAGSDIFRLYVEFVSLIFF